MKDEFERSIAAQVGAAIRAKRVAAGLSQDQLSERLDVVPESVSRMERGVVSLTIPKLVELANVLGCPVEAFIPTASGSVESGAAEIGQMLRQLDKRDMKFVVEMVEKLCGHLGGERRSV